MWREFERAEASYIASAESLQDLLDELEELFMATQPGAIRYGDKVQAGGGDPMLRYVAEKERRRLDERIREAKAIVSERKEIRDNARDDLMRSKALEDRIYVLRVIEGWGVNRITRYVHYSKSSVYRIVRNFRKMGKNGKENPL